MLLLALFAAGLAIILPKHSDKLAHQIYQGLRRDGFLFVADFESNSSRGWAEDLCCDHSFDIVADPVRGGQAAARLHLRRDDPRVEQGMRAELKRYGLFPMKRERWYGYSLFVPSDYQADDISPEIVTQWHDIPDFHLGETWRPPALSLVMSNGNWTIEQIWESSDPSVSEKSARASIPLGAVETGRWHDWVFHLKWSPEADGLLEVWHDGRPVVSKTGPNTYDDAIAPFFKLGIYKLRWNEESAIEQRTLYVDEVRISDRRGSYEMVAPGGS